MRLLSTHDHGPVLLVSGRLQKVRSEMASKRPHLLYVAAERKGKYNGID